MKSFAIWVAAILTALLGWGIISAGLLTFTCARCLDRPIFNWVSTVVVWTTFFSVGIFVPLGLFRATRVYAVVGFVACTYVYAASVWLRGFSNLCLLGLDRAGAGIDFASWCRANGFPGADPAVGMESPCKPPFRLGFWHLRSIRWSSHLRRASRLNRLAPLSIDRREPSQCRERSLLPPLVLLDEFVD